MTGESARVGKEPVTVLVGGGCCGCHSRVHDQPLRLRDHCLALVVL